MNEATRNSLPCEATHDGTPVEPRVDPLAAIFAQCQSELLGTLFCMLGDRDDAHDALQETFVKCWRRRESLDGIRNLRACVFRIAVNAARDMRTTAWRRKRQYLAEGERMVASPQPPVEEVVQQREEIQQLRDALKQLRPQEQEVFLLRQNGDMTYEEIAVALDLPTGTVKTRMRRAITQLRSAIES